MSLDILTAEWCKKQSNMNPVLLQKQIRDNANDLQDFYSDLKNWGEELKKKDAALRGIQLQDEPPKEKPKAKKSNLIKKKKLDEDSKPKGRIGFTDYSAWDKFDADAECEKVDYDENEESDLSDEVDEQQRDEAFLEKEKGNRFVKNKKWNEAIECYTRAIDYFAYDPIFYANRALCYLKINKPENAEKDCTMSLKLDKTYVKAYQRRAAARELLNKLEEAEHDLEKVLEYEPKNKESQESLKKLRLKLQISGKSKDQKEKQVEEEKESRPVSKFAAARKIQTQPSPPSEKIIDTSVAVNKWPSGDDVKLVRAVKKPPHLRSKRPLKRIEIREITGLENDVVPPNSPVKEAFKNEIIERLEPEKPIDMKEKSEPIFANVVKTIIKEQLPQENLQTPKSSVQFYSCWKHLKLWEDKYNYLKLVDPQEIPNLFKESLDSKLLSDILSVLSQCFIKNGDRVFAYLSNLAKVKRFSAFTMFMGDTDKKNVWKLIDYIKENEDMKKEDIDDLINKYEL